VIGILAKFVPKFNGIIPIPFVSDGQRQQLLQPFSFNLTISDSQTKERLSQTLK